MNSDQGRVTLVTAASRGMGEAVARLLAESGHRLVLMSRSGGSIELARELGGVGIRGSVTNPSDLENLVALAMREHGRIDGVVNNTGHAPKGDLLDISDEKWHDGLDMVMLNVIRMTRLVTPVMIEQGGGSLVNISTFAAVDPDPAFPVSASLRAGLAGFVKLYADRYAAEGIRINSVLPGMIDSYPTTESFVQRIPMRRYGTVDEVARTVRFLLSDESAYVTGQSIRVDGGMARAL